MESSLLHFADWIRFHQQQIASRIFKSIMETSDGIYCCFLNSCLDNDNPSFFRALSIKRKFVLLKEDFLGWYRNKALFFCIPHVTCALRRKVSLFNFLFSVYFQSAHLFNFITFWIKKEERKKMEEEVQSLAVCYGFYFHSFILMS